MISDFIYKYYIDPIRYEQPYNVVETITYALFLIVAVYLIYRWFKSSGITIDGKFVLATLPWVVFGGVLRVVQDTHMIKGDIQFALVTPFIYVVIFVYAFSVILLSRYLEKSGITDNYLKVYAGIGVLSVLVAGLVLLSWGAANTRIDLSVIAIILTMAMVATGIVWAFKIGRAHV